MRNVRGVIDDLRTALRENQEFAPILGAALGALSAVAVERYGPTPDQGSVAVTVTQARASLLSALALVFTGLSIVLALTSLTAGSTANMFSKRLLRMQLRRSSDKLVLGVFALTASFIVGSQILLRTRSGDSLAPPLMMIVAVILLMLTGVLIVWYINGTLQSLRVDRVIRWTGRQILRAAGAHGRAVRGDVVVPEIDLERPADAADVPAPDHGYLVRIDTNRLADLMASEDARIVIEAGTGQATILDEPIGWMSTSGTLSQRDLDRVLDCLTIAKARDPRSDIGYTVQVLVDIALMALSPAVNDPQTGVECVEMLTAVCAELSRQRLGIRTRKGSDGSPSVVVREQTMGDHLDAAGRQILLYGSEDQTVTAALLRLGEQGQRFATSDHDRDLARAFTVDVESDRANGAQSAGRGL